MLVKERVQMTYAERFPRFAKEENKAIRAWYYSLAHLWCYMKTGEAGFPPKQEELPPHVARMCKFIGQFSGNPNERMFIFPVGKAKAVYRDPETGEETPVEDTWEVLFEYIDEATAFAGGKYDYCRESGVGSFENGQSCYCDGVICSNYMGEAAKTGFPEATYKMTREEFRAKVEHVREIGTLLIDFGYGPPDNCVHNFWPGNQCLTMGFCPQTKAGSYCALWRPIVDSVGHNNSLFTAEIDRNKCSGCGRCTCNCTVGIIEYEPVSGRAYMSEPEYCMGCGRCQVACQEGAVKLLSHHKDISAYVRKELECRTSATAEPPLYDEEIWASMPPAIAPDDMSWWEENWDVDKLYREWLEARKK